MTRRSPSPRPAVLVALAAALCASAAYAQTPPPSTAATAVSAEPSMTAVATSGLVGELYTPAGPPARRAAVLVLGGSEGGTMGSGPEARLLARHGYVALAVAYFGAAARPGELTNIPLEYFKTALDVLRGQPGVDPARIGLMGTSKGAEAALLVASRNREVKAVVAGVPSSVAWQGVNRADYADRSGSWTENGRPVPFIPMT